MEKIEKWISNNKDIEQELIRLRRHFHEHPEVGHPLLNLLMDLCMPVDMICMHL